MCVEDEIARLGTVDGALRGALPGVIGVLVARKGTHKIDFREILELNVGDVFQFTSDDEVKELFGRCSLAHSLALRRLGRFIGAHGPVRIW